MSKSSINRRKFLQAMGVSAAGLALGSPKIIAQTKNGILVEDKSQYGDFLIEKLKSGKFPYQCDPKIIKPMLDRGNVFGGTYDPVYVRPKGDMFRSGRELNHERLVVNEGKQPNFTRLDYAFMNSSWWCARQAGGIYQWYMDKGEGARAPWDPADLDMTWQDVSVVMKHAATFFGASLAGVAELNPLWIYEEYLPPKDAPEQLDTQTENRRPERGSGMTRESMNRMSGRPRGPRYVPADMNRVIALVFEEDYHAIANSYGKLASAACGNGYSRMAFTATTLAMFINELGWRAIPAGNDTALSIPIAIDAGLGQLGRNGILITPKFGPRVRLAKVITDMPLAPDTPIDFGVTEFCDSCLLCASKEGCPSGSICDGERTWKGPSIACSPGSLKWYVQPESCNDFNDFSCSSCKKVCPFNKPNNSWLHRMIRKTILARSKTLDKVMVKLDQLSGYGEQLEDKDFWKLGSSYTITGREPV